MKRHSILKAANRELWEKLSAESDAFFERMYEYELLPADERLEKFRSEVKDAEANVLEIVYGKYHGSLLKFSRSDDDVEIAWWLLSDRQYALEKMFALHCNDVEVKRFEHQNTHLQELTRDMFARTGKVYRHILDMPLEDKCDDIEIEGTLRYWGESAQDTLRLEDDAFYGSDFVRILPIVAIIQQVEEGNDAIVQCNPCWIKNDYFKSSMTDKELGIDNVYDDDISWAEEGLRHRKLEHIVICYATHAVVTHYLFSIPDFLRMNTFEVKVEVKLQQISEQDGNCIWWWNSCSEQQFINKFLHEAAHRPTGVSKGEFIRKRATEYFNFEEQDNDMPITENDADLYSEKAMSSLPDCRKDESLIEDFLKIIRRKVLGLE